MTTDLERITTEPVDHHDPFGRGDYLSIEHVERYRFAAMRLAPGSRVLDLACGAGYGTAMLAVHGCVTTGVDCDPRTVSIACEAFPAGAFQGAAPRELPFADASFDAVVSFETIEHVLDGERFLLELRRVLRPGGRLIASTPNVAYTAHPDFHLHEYRPAEFFGLVERVFGATERLGQYVRLDHRASDLYRWHVKPTLLAAAQALGVRQLVRRLKGKPCTPGAPPPPAASRIAALRTVLAESPHPEHGVRAYTRDRLMRIMVAVASHDSRGRA